MPLIDFIICNHCNNSLCLTCAKKWLIDQSVTYTCPFCKKGWDWNFIFSNFPKDFIDKDLKQLYAKICNDLHMAVFVHPLILEKEFVENLNKMFRILATNKFTMKNIEDFNKIYIPHSYYDNHIYTIQSYNKEYYYKYHSYCSSKYDITNKQINPILKMYKLINNIIDFNIFIRMFANKNNGNTFKSKLYEIYLLYNMYLDKYDEVINLNSFLNIIMLKNTINLKKFKQENNFLTKYDLVKKIHKILVKYKSFLQNSIKQQPKSNLKCFKPNCDGTIEKHNHQLICMKCNSIFCTKCHIEIYPE